MTLEGEIDSAKDLRDISSLAAVVFLLRFAHTSHQNLLTVFWYLLQQRPFFVDFTMSDTRAHEQWQIRQCAGLWTPGPGKRWTCQTQLRHLCTQPNNNCRAATNLGGKI
ncbi:hypothetical protein [uncultured Roseobacter sp.]|uniref:hypothetical protein n=1 Tax=uncultured Roseobacter sp. TaxID=114847 RepID=UPI00260FA367|nr:hypothetical protein [uncultured Roseobacter sp.]